MAQSYPISNHVYSRLAAPSISEPHPQTPREPWRSTFASRLSFRCVPEPQEYLLYPEKLGPEFYGGPAGVISFRSETPYLRGKWGPRELNPRKIPLAPSSGDRETNETRVQGFHFH
jgi:hypothetical protein